MDNFPERGEYKTDITGTEHEQKHLEDECGFPESPQTESSSDVTAMHENASRENDGKSSFGVVRQSSSVDTDTDYKTRENYEGKAQLLKSCVERNDFSATVGETGAESSTKSVQRPLSSDINVETETQAQVPASFSERMGSKATLCANDGQSSSTFVQQPSSSDVNSEAEEQPQPQPQNQAQRQTSSDERADFRASPMGNTFYPWTFDSLGARWNPETSTWTPDQFGRIPPMVPVLFPAPLAGFSQGQVEDQFVGNGGIFAVPIVPMFGPFVGYPPSGLIPVSYNIPPQSLPGIGTSSSAPQTSERVLPGQAPHAAQGVEPPVNGPNLGQVQRLEGQRPMVRRFHVAFQIDLLLILKLAVVIFIFNQDGSRDRLFLLLFLAGLVYLYQTGALTPFLRWVSLSAQRAMMPPPPQQPVQPVQPGDARGEAQIPRENAAENGQPQGEAANEVLGDDPIAPAGAAEDGARQNQQPHVPAWWGFLKEIQMLVVGFVTSLLPGFHQHLD